MERVRWACNGEDIFPNGRSHINGIESFCSFAKRRLQKFNGIDKSSFDLHLKECDFRFNNRNKNMYNLLLGHFNKSSL